MRSSHRIAFRSSRMELWYALSSCDIEMDVLLYACTRMKCIVRDIARCAPNESRRGQRVCFLVWGDLFLARNGLFCFPTTSNRLFRCASHCAVNKETHCLPRSYESQTIRDYWARRPISVVARFGQIGYELTPSLASYLHHTLWLSNGQFRTITPPTESEEAHRQHVLQESTKRQAVRLREALTNLGPAFVKAGQQLAIRPDLVPPPVLKELQKLCDSVRPIPDEVALRVLQEELGLKQLAATATTVDDREPPFTECDDAGPRSLDDLFEDVHLVASASLGQVYKARIRDSGDEVAIKVQRPGMQKAFSLDLCLLMMGGEVMDALTTTFTKQAPFYRALFESFSKGSYSELDYENEARNQMHFQHELAKRKCKVKVPSVYQQYSTQRILTSEWIEGTKLADSPKEKIQELIPIGVELFLTQLLDIGSFHSDPHPGNLLVTEDGVLCLLDFGLCAEVDSKSREAMTKAIVHLLYRDFDTLIHSDTKELGFLPQDFDTSELKPILTKILAGGLMESGSDLKKRKRKMMEISNELNEIFFRYPFQVPGFFALVTRGLGLLEGIALVGDPDFDIFMASAPYASKRAVSILGKQGYRRLSRAMTRGTKFVPTSLS
jgi:aarF domain-containing kinase